MNGVLRILTIFKKRQKNARVFLDKAKKPVTQQKSSVINKGQ